jgi:hypothetical protein
MPASLISQTSLNRGATILFNTTFYDPYGNIIQPVSAFVNIDYPNPDGSRAQVTLTMGASFPPAVNWTAEWDSRGAGTGTVFWSIHTNPSVPIAVEDGQFQLTANQANLTTF